MIGNRVKIQESEEQLGISVRRKSAKTTIFQRFVGAQIIKLALSAVKIIENEPYTYKRLNWKSEHAKESFTMPYGKCQLI